ncbi:hypothetical protein HYV81_01520 [Candidatus Woesearchaeota archaeon]|nr:hypothetical protein [Candidatus Woesearchaeota archaeon]
MLDFNYNQSTRMTIASIPLVIALVLLVPLFNEEAITIGASGIRLAPVRDNSFFVLSLLGFMLAYALLLSFFFSKDLRAWLHGIRKEHEPMRHVTVRKKR